MRHADRARTNPACRQTEKTVIPLLALGAAIAFFTMLSSGVNAADLALPPRVVGQPQYGLAPSPAIPPPQVIIIPGPTAPPPYNGAMLPPPVVGSPPYGLAPRVAPRVYAERRSACPLAWRCGDRGCGWQPGCAPPLERYPGGPQVYSGPGGAPAPDQYPWPVRVASIPRCTLVLAARQLQTSILASTSCTIPRCTPVLAAPELQITIPGRLVPRCTPVLVAHQLQTSILASTSRSVPRCTPVRAADQLQTSIPASTIRSVPRYTPVLAAHQLQARIPTGTSRLVRQMYSGAGGHSPRDRYPSRYAPQGHRGPTGPYWAIVVSIARKRGPRCRHHNCFDDREARRQDRFCRRLTPAQRAQVAAAD